MRKQKKKEIFKNADDLQEKLTRAHLDIAKKMAESAGWKGAYNDLLKRVREAVKAISKEVSEFDVEDPYAWEAVAYPILRSRLPELEEK